MGLFALGINHTTASVELRERLAFVPEQLEQALREASRVCQLHAIIILSTCNRTEVYALTDMPEILTAWLAESRGVPLTDLLPHTYHYKQEDALKHLMRVSSGLDSMLLGEPQILGQVKQALQHAKAAGTVTPALLHIFDQAFHAAKKVRTETAVGEHAISMGFAVAQLARQVFSHLNETTALLVSAGEMNTLVGKYLAEQGVGRILVCNRTFERAQDLAAELNHKVPTQAISFEQLADMTAQADIVCSSTGSLEPVLHCATIRKALKKRRFQPMLLIDLAVPRDIEPATADLEQVYLYTVDDLQKVIAGNMEQRQQAAIQAEQLVQQLASRAMQHEQGRQVGPLIAQYRQQAESIRQQEVIRAQQLLAQGQPVEQVLERLSQSLMAKLLHAPSQLIRESAQHALPEVLEVVKAELLSHDNARH